MDLAIKETILFAFVMESQPKGRENGEDILWGFYPSSKTIELCYEKNPDEIVKVKVTPYKGDCNSAPYWAWWDNKRQEFCHVYYYKDMVKMCFPYEIKLYEASGDGQLLPVNVERT